MNEPRRLRDEPHSALERSLLEAGRSYKASHATRRRALSALGVATVTATTSAAASTLTKAGLVKWALAAVVVGGGALSAVHYLRAPQVAAHPAPSVASISAPSASPAIASAPAAPEAEPTPPEVVPPPAPSVALTPRPAASAPLAAELSALDAARASLSSGNPGAALTALDAYARAFPHGKLAIEAEVLRIDALAKSGQTATARKRAEAFIKRHPDSVLSSRVRSAVGL